MTMHKVYIYDTGRVHWAEARREDIAKMWDPADVTVENWSFWRTACGKEVIANAGPVATDQDVNCQPCARAAEQAARVIQRWT